MIMCTSRKCDDTIHLKRYLRNCFTNVYLSECPSTLVMYYLIVQCIHILKIKNWSVNIYTQIHSWYIEFVQIAFPIETKFHCNDFILLAHLRRI